MSSSSTKYSRIRNEKAGVLVETALALPLVLLLIAAIFDLTWIISSRTQLDEAARAAGRAVVTLRDDPPDLLETPENHECKEYRQRFTAVFNQHLKRTVATPEITFFEDDSSVLSEPLVILRARVRAPLNCLFCQGNIFKPSYDSVFEFPLEFNNECEDCLTECHI